MRLEYNPYKRQLVVFGFLMVSSLAAALAEYLYFGLLNSVLFPWEIVVFLVTLILFFVTWKKFGEVNDLLAGRSVVAKWQYAPDEWAQFAASENARKDAKTGFLKSILPTIIIAVVITACSFLFAPQLFGFILPVSIIAVGFTGYQDWQRYQLSNLKVGQPDDVPLAYISREGIWINKQYFSFSGQTYLKASYELGEPSVIQFDWQTKERSGVHWSTYSHHLRLPVPQNQVAEIDKVLTNLGAQR